MKNFCIYCGCDDVMLADSHVIPKSIRKRLTGLKTSSGNTQYKFRWFDRPDLPSQDLPKPNLLCERHDNLFGSKIEGFAAQALMPAKHDFSQSHHLPPNWKIISLPLDEGEVRVGSYNAPDAKFDDAVRKFAVLTAWRALHALRLDGEKPVVDFLRSVEGEQLNASTIRFLNLDTDHIDLLFENFAEIYFTGPDFAIDLTGSDEDMPFAYAYLERNNQIAIGVMMGFWVIVWPLLKDSDPMRDYEEICNMVFLDWREYMLKKFTNS